MTDAITMSVAGPHLLNLDPAVRSAARRAVVWRYLRDSWTAQELADVLAALGLA